MPLTPTTVSGMSGMFQTILFTKISFDILP